MEDLIDFTRKRITHLRTIHDISARNLSLSLGLNHSYINKIEKGDQNPSLETIELLCNFFNISVQDFFDEGNGNPIELTSLLQEAKRTDSETLKLLTGLIRKINE